MIKSTYIPRGVCSRKIEVTLEDGIVRAVEFTGGCSGNTQGISKLVVGRPAAEVIGLLRGISCGGKPTSCPDQLSYALEAAMAKEQA